MRSVRALRNIVTHHPRFFVTGCAGFVLAPLPVLRSAAGVAAGGVTR